MFEEQQLKPKPQIRYAFRLSKTNIIYAISAIIFIYIVYLREWDVSYALGGVLGLLIIPIFLASLVWYIHGRKKNGGSTTFNIVLTIMLLIRLGFLFEELKKPPPQAYLDMSRSYEKFETDMRNAPESIESTYRELNDAYLKEIDDLIRTSVSDDKQFYLTFKNFYVERIRIDYQWQAANEIMISPRLLDISLLSSTAECDYQMDAIHNFIEKCIAYREYYENCMTYFTDKTKELKPGDKNVIAFRRGLQNAHNHQEPIINAYLNTYIKYGQDIIRIIEILKRDNGQWYMEDDMIVFDYGSSHIMYVQLIDSLTEKEDILIKLENELADLRY